MLYENIPFTFTQCIWLFDRVLQERVTVCVCTGVRACVCACVCDVIWLTPSLMTRVLQETVTVSACVMLSVRPSASGEGDRDDDHQS